MLPTFHDSPPFGVTTASAPAAILKLLLLVSQTDGAAMLHTRRRARLVAGPVTSQFCAPSFPTLAKIGVHVAPASRDSLMLTLLPTGPALVH